MPQDNFYDGTDQFEDVFIIIRAELKAQQIRRNSMSEEVTEESKRLNTSVGQELQKEQNTPVTPEEAEAAHEENQGFEKPAEEKYG